MKIRFCLWCLCLSFLVLSVQAQNIAVQPCIDNSGRTVPGFVQADCSKEDDLIRKYENSQGENFTCDAHVDDTCEKLISAHQDCRAQCIPKVTNGGILPGPADGAQARGYVLDNFLPNLTNSFLIFSMIMSILLLIVSGFMWIFASGNTELAKRARDTAIWSIIGLTIGVAAYLIVQIVININFFA